MKKNQRLKSSLHSLDSKIDDHTLRVRRECHSSFSKKKGGQADGLISIGKLNTLLYLHTQPIYHIVYMVSHWDTLS